MNLTNEEKRAEPLHCPFCGGVPVVEPIEPELQGNAFGRVSCFNVKCPAQPTVDDGETVSDDRGSDAYKAIAIARWNRRA